MNPLVAYHRAGKERGALNLRDVRPESNPIWVSGFRAEVRPWDSGIEMHVPKGLIVFGLGENRFPHTYRAPGADGEVNRTVIFLSGESVTLRRPKGRVNHIIGVLASGPNDGRLALRQIAAMKASVGATPAQI